MAELVIPNRAAEELDYQAGRFRKLFPDSPTRIKGAIIRRLRQAAAEPQNRGRYRGDSEGQQVFLDSVGSFWTLCTYDPETDFFILHRVIYTGDEKDQPGIEDLAG